MLTRRGVIGGTAALLGGMALPSCAPVHDRRVMRFVPQADLASLDPIWTTAGVTRAHGFLVYDTLFGLGADFRPQPQMVEAVEQSADGRDWTLRLRPGLNFHDGEPVRARDCVASLERWSHRDAMGQALFAAADEVAAPDDRHIRFRLREPFPLLPDALGKIGVNTPFIMAERHARTSPFVQVSEMVGSGPYRFLPDERVVGARAAYARFDGYVPRAGEMAEWTAGPKRAKFERVEWTVIPDPATASIALRNGEIDWLETPSIDLLPLIGGDPKLALPEIDPTGAVAVMRPNHLWPPFDNVAIRRAVLRVVRQEAFLAAAGFAPGARRAGVGIFPPETPLATSAGLQIWDGPPDYARAREEIRAAGYKGEPVLVMGTTDPPILRALAEVGADLLRRCGFTIDYQVMDWNAVIQRRARRAHPSEGGWNVFFTHWTGLDLLNPAGHMSLRGTGEKAWFGWPTAPRLEALRDAWMREGDPDAQRRIAEQIQLQALQDVPYIPLGQFHMPTACRRSLTGMLHGLPLFWNVENAGHG
jgi:peptide/nickel transport system substrate-binding protein